MSGLRFSLVLMIFLVFASQAFMHLTFAEDSGNEAASALINAEEDVVSAYQAVLKAEDAGANVSGLLARLDEAGGFLAQARMAYRLEDFDKATLFANLSMSVVEEVNNEAVKLRDSVLREGLQRTLLTMIASVVGVAVIALGSLWTWHLLKKRYGRVNF